MNVKFHKITSYTWNFQNFTCVFTFLVKFDIHFLGLPLEIFLVLLALKKEIKNKKKSAMFLKLFWYKVHCPLKVKITQFPGGLRLDTYTFTNNRSSATFEQ